MFGVSLHVYPLQLFILTPHASLSQFIELLMHKVCWLIWGDINGSVIKYSNKI